jgi:hypothetical protein
MGKDYKFKHQQHTAKFINELNSVTSNKPFTPFRISDEVWLVGKHKGKKISESPASYIEWAITNMNLTDTARSILINHK